MPPAPVIPAVAMMLALLPLGACFDVSLPTAPTSSTDAATGGYEAELALCVSLTNSYRATVSRGALTRAVRLDNYAAEAARHDATAREAHQYVKATNFGNGLVRAENELLWWPLSTYGTVRKVVESGLAQMWAEGTGGDHRRNMMGDYAEIGCGIFVRNGEVTLAQAFR